MAYPASTSPPPHCGRNPDVLVMFARPSASLALNGSQRARPAPTSCPAMPSTRAIHASAAAMATARLRSSAPTPTPLAANATLTATPPARVRQESADDREKLPLLADHQAAVTA